MDIAAQFNQYFMEQGHHLGAYILCITLLDILPDYRTNLNTVSYTHLTLPTSDLV